MEFIFDHVDKAIFFSGLLVGFILRDAVRVVVVSALSMPLVLVAAQVWGPSATLIGNFGAGFWWFAVFLFGMIAAIALLVGFALVQPKFAVLSHRTVARTER